MRKWFAIFLILSLLLTGCTNGSTAPDSGVTTGTTTPLTTIPPTTVPPTTVPPTTVAPTTLPPETEPPPVLQSGYYILSRMSYSGITLSGESLDYMRYYIYIEDDHTGIMSAMGIEQSFEWNETQLISDGVPIDIIIDGNTLTLTDVDDVEISFLYYGSTLPESFTIPALPAGLYVVSSIGENGDVSFFSSLDPANGYLRLEADCTGILYYNGSEVQITCDANYIYAGETSYAYIYYSPDMTPDGEAMLMFYDIQGDTFTTVILRLAEGTPL